MQMMIPAGVNVLSFLREKGVFVPAHCGGAGACGKCVIKVIAGSLPPSEYDKRLLSRQSIADGARLACKAFTASPVRIEINDHSAFNTPDIKWEQPDKSHTFGLAADIGTTTIAVSLVDITAKRSIRTVSAANAQGSFGADVITRIGAALSGEKAALRKAVTKSLADAVGRLDCASLELTKMTIAANTAMYHMLLGLDCTGIAKAPFEPATLGGEQLSLQALLDDSAAPDIPVTLVRGISPFVGGDITSGLACTPLADNTLLLDLGTNGEAVLFSGGRFICSSAAAGPALEGGELSCGMGGVNGAVCRVYEHDGRLRFDTIGSAPPLGLCGSGAVDLLACCIDKGYVDKQGVFLDSYFESGFELASSVTLTQQDIRELQLAKAAIRACVDTLISHAGKKYEDISQLIIAGGFGHFLDIQSACKIGLIPNALKCKARAVGNTSLKGVECSLYDERFFGRLDDIISRAETVELSSDEGFKARFIENIGF